MSKSHYVRQAGESGGFWMSLHELTSDYPWLVKRMAAMKALASGQEIEYPARNPLAVVLALFIPRFGLGGGAAPLMLVAIIGILAAVALPAYQDYTIRSKLVGAVAAGKQATTSVTEYFNANGAIPESLEHAGSSANPSSPAVQSMMLDSSNGIIRVVTSVAPHAGKAIVFTPRLDANKKIVWRCGSDDIPAKLLPAECRP